MCESTTCWSGGRRSDRCYCSRCDVLVGLDGLHVIAVDELADGGGWLQVTVESAPAVQACRECGVVAHSHGRRSVRLIDTGVFRPAGAVAVAQADLAVRRARLRGRVVHRAA